MFRYQILPIFLLSVSGVCAQNLVPNPSFENYKSVPCSWTTVPTEFSQYADSWVIPTNTSTDIHNTLASPNCWANPMPAAEDGSCRMGVQQPHSGNAMAGLYTIVNSHVWHEYIQVKLMKPLIPGQRYCVEMWVSLADNVSSGSNNLGMLFSKAPVTGEDQIVAKPQVNWPEVITDTQGWSLISTSFIATEDDEYLTIGNFLEDTETRIENTNTNFCSDGAYYYVDDIVVMLCPV